MPRVMVVCHEPDRVPKSPARRSRSVVILVCGHAAHRDRRRSGQPPRPRDRRNPQGARPRHGPAHARVDPRRARRRGLRRARTSSSSAATRPRSSAPATPSSRSSRTATGSGTTSWRRSSARASTSAAGFVSTLRRHRLPRLAVKKLVASPHDKVLVCDTDWRRRYVDRIACTPRATARRCAPRATGSSSCRGASPPSRPAASSSASPSSPPTARASWSRRSTRRGPSGRATVWREGRTFERAYLIDLFQEMIERGSAFHRVDTHGGYMEIDTRRGSRVRREVVARVAAGVVTRGSAPHSPPPRPAAHERPEIALDGVAQAVRRAAAASASAPRSTTSRCASTRGRVRRRRRPERMRQVDDAAHRRRSRRARRGHGRHRGAPDERRPAAGPRRRHGLPGLRALPADDGAPDPRVPAQDARACPRRIGRARSAEAAALLAHRALARPAPWGALRRRTPARGDGPRDRAQAARLPLRRAALEPRRVACAPTFASRSASSCAASARPRST